MPIDVTARVHIERPVGEVTAWVMDPANDLAWIRALTASEKLADGPVGRGMGVRRVAKMMGRSMPYTTEVVEFEPLRMVMKTVEGPFPMVVTYAFAADDGGTAVTVRNQGGEGLLFKLFGRPIGWMVNSRVNGDLKQMKWVLEQRPRGGTYLE